jgi:2,3-dihydroxybenzoate-AMP ligase
MPDAPAVSPVAAGTVPWPEQAARAYAARGWWRGQALGTELWSAARARPGAIAVVDGETRLTGESVLARAYALATRLTDDLGLCRGDRIVVQLTNSWQFVILLLACLRAGVIPVMALPAHRRHELAYLADHSEAAAIVVPGQIRDFDHQQMAQELAAACPTVRLVLTTSQTLRAGSTSLTALCAEPADPDTDRKRWDADPPASRDVAVFLLSGGTRRRARGRAAVDTARAGARCRPAAHAHAAAGRRRPAGRRDRAAGQAGPGRHLAAGIRHGRGTAELHPAR